MKEYFSHDYSTRLDDKIKLLIRKHGMIGYGSYWAIIEDLYNNANALRLDCEGIAYDLRVDESLVKSIINDFDLFVIDGDEFGSLSVGKRIEQRNERSKKARESALSRWNKKQDDANALRTECDSNAIKEKKRKEKEINIPFDVFWNLYNKKVAKVKCEPKWNNLKDEERQKIIDTLPGFISSIRDKQYQPNPETYINQRRWEDEVENKKLILLK
jgi:hypothetical protein